MIVRAVVVLTLLVPAHPSVHASAPDRAGDDLRQAVAGVVDDPINPPPPPATVNEFLPDDRALSDCISALPRPGCGSEARGGWRQGVVLLSILAGLSFIGWRIWLAARRARRAAERTDVRADQPEREWS